MHLDNRKAKEIVFYSDFGLLLTGPPPIPWGGRVSIIITVRFKMRPFLIFFIFFAAKLQQLNNFVYLRAAFCSRNAHSANMGRDLKFVHSLRGSVHAPLLVKKSSRKNYGGKCCTKL